MSRSTRGAPLVATGLIWVYAVVSSYPLLWLAFQSLRPDAEILGRPWGLPTRPSTEGYVTAFESTPLVDYFVNSLLVTLAVVVLSVSCCVGAGYALSRLRFRGSDAVLGLFVAALALPAPILLLPVFLISRDLGLLNSYVGLVAPYAAGVLPLGVYLVKTHFDEVPDELAEAACLDRAAPWQVFTHVMAPLVLPAAATVAVLAFMASWNEYVYALMALQDEELYTLPVGIADLGSKKFLVGYAPVFSAMLVAAVPVYVAFVVAQRSFLRSFSVGGGVKG